MRVFTTDQKCWLMELREINPESKRSILAQEFKDTLGSDLLSRSTVRDWLKRDAVKMLCRSKLDRWPCHVTFA